jgi:hypothetical protein
MARVPQPRDSGERPEGHHAGSRWRTNPPGDWWPRGHDESDPDQPPPLPDQVDGEHLGRRR